MKKIAIIPARSGSKGLKNKNIIDLCGKPLINYSIEAAVKANCFERIIVSTDSEKYGHIAESAGAEVIFRGEELSNDTASSYMVLEDLFNRITNDFDYFVLLQPTSPFRNYKHILEAVNIYEKGFNKFDFLVSMKEAEHAKFLINPIEDDLSLKHFCSEELINYRRQSFKDYTPNGAIYIGKVNKYLQQKHFLGPKSIAYIMSKKDSIDIDDEIDYKYALTCLKEKL